MKRSEYMVNEIMYQSVVKNLMDLRENGKLKKNDLIIMMYLLAILNCEEYKEVKQMKICQFTSLTKSEVSKSISRLLENEILEKKSEYFESGFKITM